MTIVMRNQNIHWAFSNRFDSLPLDLRWVLQLIIPCNVYFRVFEHYSFSAYYFLSNTINFPLHHTQTSLLIITVINVSVTNLLWAKYLCGLLLSNMKVA